MTLHRQIIALFAMSIAMLAMAPSASAGLLYFSINDGVGNSGEGNVVSTPALTDMANSRTLEIRVRSTDATSNGEYLHSFGFSLKVLNPAVVRLTNVQLNGTQGVDYSSSNAQVDSIGTPGEFATASAVYRVVDPISSARPNIRKDINNVEFQPGDGVLLATFTITGVGTGSSDIRIEELTAGNGDFQTTAGLFTTSTAGRDFRELSDDSFEVGAADGLGDASTFLTVTSSVTAVPEPASSALVAGGLAVAFMARWRRRKQARAAMPA